MSFESPFKKMVPTNNLAALGTFTAGELMNLSATDRTGEGNDTDR
jgi:hypothetical protein